MKKISAILAMILVFAMTIVPVSADDSVTVSIGAASTSVAPGADIVVSVSFTPTDVEVASMEAYITYDPSLVSYVGNAVPNGSVQLNSTSWSDKIKVAAAAATDWKGGKIIDITFKAADAASGKASFGLQLEVVDDINGMGMLMYEAGTATVDVTIGNGGSSEPEEPKVFGVTAIDNGTNTVVTVANKGDLEGLVYAASYDSNNVLVNCATAQALKDGELTFAGITGNVKVFVWDANNAPLLDAFVIATVQ